MGPRAGLDGCGKSPPTPGFDPPTVHRIASRYTDWVISVPLYVYIYVCTPYEKITSCPGGVRIEDRPARSLVFLPVHYCGSCLKHVAMLTPLFSSDQVFVFPP